MLRGRRELVVDLHEGRIALFPYVGVLPNAPIAPLRPTLGRIGQPTLIAHGAHSHLYGSDTADFLGAAIPRSKIVQFDQSGHSPHIEQPELFNRALRDFAASLPRVRSNSMTA